MGGVPVMAGSPFSTHWFVDNIGGSADALGTSPAGALSTIAAAVAFASAGDTIHIKGTTTNYTESVVCTLDRMTFVGHSFVEGAGWTPAAQNGTCLTLSGSKGTRVTGILFRPNGTTGIGIDLSETVADDTDSVTIDNCVFKSTGQDVGYHIFANGCPAYVKIYHNHFTWGVVAIGATSASNTSATGWEIISNYFSDKITKGIYLPCRRCLIKDNHFSTMTTTIDTVGYAATNGDYNDVNGNYIFETATWSSVTNGQANDSWQNNFHNFLPNVTIGGS